MTLSDFSILLLALNPAIWSSCTAIDNQEFSSCLCEIRGISESKADNAKSLHIFIFDDDSLKRLDSYMVTGATGTVSISSRVGQKILCAVWSENFDGSGIEGYEGLCGKQFLLTDENPSAPARRAQTGISMGSQKTVEIEMEPVLSSIRLKRVRCDFSGKPYSKEIIRSPKIYLTNVNAQCGVMDSENIKTEVILNNGGYNANDDSECKGMLSTTLAGDIDRDWKTLNGTMYCYPNTNEEEVLGAPFTRLVVEGEVGGEKYWWPIDINRRDFGWQGGKEGILPNGDYELSLTIKRLGSKDPDTPVSPCDVVIESAIVPWVVMDMVTEEY